MLMTTNNSNKMVQSNARSWSRNSNYGSPPWKTGAALRFLSLRRDFLQDCWRSKAALKPKSLTMRCCWDAGGGLATSKRLFTGLRLIVLFFWLRRGITQIAGTWRNRKGDTYKNVLDSPLFHKSWDPDTGSGCQIIGWWLDATHRIPLLWRVFNHPPPIKSLIHAPTDVSHHLRKRYSLHVAPRLENGAMRDPVRDGCRLSQPGDAGVRKEVPLGEMQTLYKILYTKDGTVHFICTDHHPIQIDDALPATSHWSEQKKSC